MTRTPSRREFVAQSALAGAAMAFGACAPARTAGPGADSRMKEARPFEISLAQWSLHRALYEKKLDAREFPTVAARDFGCTGAEYVSGFYAAKALDMEYWREVKTRASDVNIRNVLVMVDGEGSLGDARSRMQAIDNHKKWIDVAAYLGCHSIRVNAHGEGTPEEQAKNTADSLVKLAEYGSPRNVNVLVENHGGLSSNGAWLAGVVRVANHPRVGTLPDFGNFSIDATQRYDRYAGVKELMPFAKGVSAKSYTFDEQGNESTMDYRRLLTIVLEAGYRGFIGVEYEGAERPEPEGIRLTKALLERLRAEWSAARA